NRLRLHDLGPRKKLHRRRPVREDVPAARQGGSVSRSWRTHCSVSGTFWRRERQAKPAWLLVFTGARLQAARLSATGRKPGFESAVGRYAVLATKQHVHNEQWERGRHVVEERLDHGQKGVVDRLARDGPPMHASGPSVRLVAHQRAQPQ